MSILKILIIIKNTKDKKGTAGMNFENFAARIAESNQIDNFKAPIKEDKEQQRFTVICGEMQKKKKNCHENKIFLNQRQKISLSEWNYIIAYRSSIFKRSYFVKEKKGEKIEKYFVQEKNNFKKFERVFKILNITVYKAMKKTETDNLNKNFSRSTKSYILESKWL